MDAQGSGQGPSFVKSADKWWLGEVGEKPAWSAFGLLHLDAVNYSELAPWMTLPALRWPAFFSILTV